MRVSNFFHSKRIWFSEDGVYQYDPMCEPKFAGYTADEMKDKSFCVAWFTKNGTQGHGDFVFNYFEADDLAEAYNEKHKKGDIYHYAMHKNESVRD